MSKIDIVIKDDVEDGQVIGFSSNTPSYCIIEDSRIFTVKQKLTQALRELSDVTEYVNKDVTLGLVLIDGPLVIRDKDDIQTLADDLPFILVPSDEPLMLVDTSLIYVLESSSLADQGTIMNSIMQSVLITLINKDGDKTALSRDLGGLDGLREFVDSYMDVIEQVKNEAISFTLSNHAGRFVHQSLDNLH